MSPLSLALSFQYELVGKRLSNIEVLSLQFRTTVVPVRLRLRVHQQYYSGKHRIVFNIEKCLINWAEQIPPDIVESGFPQTHHRYHLR